MASEQRKHPRAPLALLVQYRFDSLDDFMAEYSVDISMGGMFIRTSAPRKAGSMIYLQFTLKDGSKLIEALGKVVHASDKGMGIEFVNVDDESMALIEQIVRSNLAK